MKNALYYRLKWLRFMIEQFSLNMNLANNLSILLLTCFMPLISFYNPPENIRQSKVWKKTSGMRWVKVAMDMGKLKKNSERISCNISFNNMEVFSLVYLFQLWWIPYCPIILEVYCFLQFLEFWITIKHLPKEFWNSKAANCIKSCSSSWPYNISNCDS